MMNFLYYDAKVAVLIAIFYMFYRLLLQRDSLHQLNRFVLLGTALLSFILPFCVITLHYTKVVKVAAPVEPTAHITEMTGISPVAHADVATQIVAESTPWWQIALAVVFILGFIITLSFTVISIVKVCILIRACEKHPQDDGTIIAVADGDIAPFSWMRYIVLSRSDYENPEEAIMMHERGHIRRRHSIDVLLVDVLTSFQWFNPAMWMLRNDLRDIHEYEADSSVLSQGINVRQYQYLLIRKAMAAGGYSVANGINHSTLKQRIAMMQNNKNNRYSWLKALYILPVVLISLAAFATPKVDVVTVPQNTNQKANPYKVRTANKALRAKAPKMYQKVNGKMVEWKPVYKPVLTFILAGDGNVCYKEGNAPFQQGDWLNVNSTSWDWQYNDMSGAPAEIEFRKNLKGFKLYVYASTETPQSEIDHLDAIIKSQGIKNYELVKGIKIYHPTEQYFRDWAKAEKAKGTKFAQLFNLIAKKHVGTEDIRKHWHVVKQVYGKR